MKDFEDTTAVRSRRRDHTFSIILPKNRTQLADPPSVVWKYVFAIGKALILIVSPFKLVIKKIEIAPVLFVYFLS